jgi:predicted histone-like DNA-binding protein
MSVKYNVVQRGNPSEPTDPKKYYPSIASTGRVSLRQLAQGISRTCTVSSADVMAVLEGMLAVIPEELSRGNIVELGDFGSFWLKANADGVENAEETRASQITNLLPRFNPGKEFKKVINTIEFERA